MGAVWQMHRLHDVFGFEEHLKKHWCHIYKTLLKHCNVKQKHNVVHDVFSSLGDCHPQFAPEKMYEILPYFFNPKRDTGFFSLLGIPPKVLSVSH